MARRNRMDINPMLNPKTEDAKMEEEQTTAFSYALAPHPRLTPVEVGNHTHDYMTSANSPIYQHSTVMSPKISNKSRHTTIPGHIPHTNPWDDRLTKLDSAHYVIVASDQVVPNVTTSIEDQVPQPELGRSVEFVSTASP
ncbi:uncharacterized protein PAC_17975 [Phialocephala subalpina]|uniref:Uncharacterized protein n=1 Tax=Phialocephala subalpina TaxID=576137 RepID=A0A1L7XSR7_9HELO|nr:uncharacterized protein PAC_17975 [Phialocephala subalpina]